MEPGGGVTNIMTHPQDPDCTRWRGRNVVRVSSEGRHIIRHKPARSSFFVFPRPLLLLEILATRRASLKPAGLPTHTSQRAHRAAEAYGAHRQTKYLTEKFTSISQQKTLWFPRKNFSLQLLVYVSVRYREKQGGVYDMDIYPPKKHDYAI